jgi:diguanylate cyclase (GGDEF)-like protein
MFGLFVLNMMRRPLEPDAFDRLAVVWGLVTVVLNITVGVMRPRSDLSVLITDLVGLFSFYVFISSRMIIRVSPALLLSFADMILAVFYKEQMPGQVVIALAFSLTITNLVGMIFSRQYFDMRRAEFLARHEEERVQAELQRLASTDPLTGVYNRRRLLELAGDALYRFRRYCRPFTIMIMDLDGFKAVNDTFGHHQGDAVLVGFAGSISAEKREADALGRMGGDEFCLVLPETTTDAAVSLAERILLHCGNISLSDTINEVHVTTSIGISQANASDTSLDPLFARADAALYSAKHSGRNRYASA